MFKNNFSFDFDSKYLFILQPFLKDSTVQRSNTQLGASLLYPVPPGEGCEGTKDERCDHQELHCGTELNCPNTSFYESHNCSPQMSVKD